MSDPAENRMHRIADDLDTLEPASEQVAEEAERFLDTYAAFDTYLREHERL